MSANYSDELFTTQPRPGGSWAAGEMLTKIHKITINSALVLRILDQWPQWARLQTSYRPQLLSLHLASSYNNIFASLKVASHPRLPIRFGTGDWVMKIFAKRLCAMCNVNNVLQPGDWAAPADKCSHLGMLSGDCCCLPCLGPAPAQMEQNGQMAQLCKLHQGKHRNQTEMKPRR